MAIYQSGKRTEFKILNVCKRLFYDNGYKNTTYKDICNAAGVNPSAIHYYYKSKGSIAGVIYNELIARNKELIKDILISQNRYDLQLCTAIEIRKMFDIFVLEKKVAEFLYDIYLERIPFEYAFEQTKDFMKLHVDNYNLELDEHQLKTVTAISLATESELIIGSWNGYLTEPYENLIKYNLEIVLGTMGLRKMRIKEIIEESYELNKTMMLEHKKYFDFNIKCI